MNDNANDTKQPDSHDLVDLLLAQLAAKVEEIETKTKREADLQEIPPDVPRFVTLW